MARIRRVSNFLCFTPPSYLDGVAQIANLYGKISVHAEPPRIIRVERKPSSKANCNKEFQAKSINSALSRDVKAVGGDIFGCMKKYDEKLCRGV
jgi:hypothetical protein